MHYEELITIYAKISNKKLREVLSTIGQPTISEIDVSYYDTEKGRSTSIDFDIDNILRHIDNGAHCSWGVAMDKIGYEGYTLSVHKLPSNVLDISIDVLVTEENEKRYLERIKEIYVQISPELGVSMDFDADYIVKPDKRPEYFEWLLILGPRLAGYIDEFRIPKVYEVIKMKDGGIIIHEDIFGKRASEEDMNAILEMIPENLSFLWEGGER